MKVESGDIIFVPKGFKYKLERTSYSDSIMIAELQLIVCFGENDINRFDDVYKG